MAQLVLRFDVDTPLCITAGMDALNRLSDERGVPFVYYVNFGRAVDLLAKLKYRPDAEDAGDVDKLSSAEKLGLGEILKLVFRNPRLIDVGERQVRAAYDQGSEVGVHGGRNHASWQWGYPQWSEARIAEEVRWSTDVFRNLFKRQPLGFSSPGWVADDRLPSLLHANGYRYRADLHGEVSHSMDEAIPNFATVLTGEPGGVGFFESCVARGLLDSQMLKTVENAMTNGDTPVVLYDHPCFAGLDGLPMLKELLDHAARRDWQITTIADML